jgi:ABC-2 type transport system ATP-binding protein
VGGGPRADGGRMTSSAIAASGLRKAYKDKIVLDGIDLDIAAGTIFSLLGPNGAGKTTTINVLTTLMKADGGTVRVAGHDVATETKAVRAAIGVTGQFAAVDELLTGQENLQLMADLKRLGSRESKRVVTDLLERFDLTESAQKMAATYSGGMRRKLDLAMTLVGRPKIVFLDEPTAGLDPRSRRTMWDIIRQLVAEGVTIFLTTQYLDEADRLADRIAVLDHGKLVAQGTPAQLKRISAATSGSRSGCAVTASVSSATTSAPWPRLTSASKRSSVAVRRSPSSRVTAVSNASLSSNPTSCIAAPRHNARASRNSRTRRRPSSWRA